MYKKYQSHVRDLSPYGEMRILKYDDTTGLYDTIKVIKNDSRVSEVQRKFLIFYFSSDEFKYSELEWVKLAIQTAKELDADKVIYYDEDVDGLGTDLVRIVKIWKKQR